MYLSLFLPVSATKNPGYYIKTNTRSHLRKEGRMRTWEPWNSMVPSSLGFLFASYVPELELKKLAAQNTSGCRPQKEKNKVSTKAYSLQPKE